MILVVYMLCICRHFYGWQDNAAFVDDWWLTYCSDFIELIYKLLSSAVEAKAQWNITDLMICSHSYRIQLNTQSSPASHFRTRTPGTSGETSLGRAAKLCLVPHGRVSPWPLWNKQLNHWILMDSEGPDFDILKQLNRCKQDTWNSQFMWNYVNMYKYIHTHIYIYIIRVWRPTRISTYGKFPRTDGIGCGHE